MNRHFPFFTMFMVLILMNFSNASELNNNQENVTNKGFALVTHESDEITPVIRVMVVYTDSAIVAYGSTEQALKDLIVKAVDSTNIYFANSNVNSRLELAHSEKVIYTEMAGDSYETWYGFPVDKDLANFKNTTDGYMDNIHSLRDQYAADICVLLVGDVDQFGQAYINANASQAFAIVYSPKTVVKKTFAHEIGHLFGAAHQEWGGTELFLEPPYPYGLAYEPNTKNWGTIMVAGEHVDDSYRIPYFSNPTIFYKYVYIGDRTHNNARVLNERAQVLSDFREGLLSVYITGPSVLYASVPLSASGESTDMSEDNQVSLRRPAPSATGTWTANPTGGDGQYTYQWYILSTSGDPDWYPIYGATGKDLTYEIDRDRTFKCTVNSAGQTAAATKFVRFISDVRFISADMNTTLENYPNPFNPVTTIRFGLPEAANVKLVIYSITGAKVATLVDGYLSEGFHEARWNGVNQAGARVASGIYIYELISGEKRFIKKMLLAK